MGFRSLNAMNKEIETEMLEKEKSSKKWKGGERDREGDKDR